MSVLDAFFGRGGAFRGARCTTLLKLTIPRIKLLRNRRVMQLKQMRRDIANLLGSGQEATARIRVEHIIREENMIAAQEILELFCELIVVRIPIIEIQRECPLDLKEAISSICFAAPRCADLPELQQAQMMFAAKYGRDFVNAATELLPDSGVNRQIIETLSIRAPAIEAKHKLLKEIAEEHGIDWDPLESETEHEDLLNGPSHLVNPLARFKKTSMPHEHTKSDSDSECDLDLPDVPRAAVPPPPSTDPDREHEDAPPLKSSNQFLPFTAPPLNPAGPPPLPPAVDEAQKHSAITSSERSELDKDLQDAVLAANAAAETAERAAAAARLAASLAQVKMTELVERTGHVSVEAVIGREDDKGEEPLESLQAVDEDLLVVPPPPDGRQTLRTTSMEDDPYFSYPNLFSRQNSSAMESATGVHSPGSDSSIHKFS